MRRFPVRLLLCSCIGALALAGALAVGVPLSAQVITGTVLEPDFATPARGVLVELRRSGAREPMRALTTARGTFRFALAAPDTVFVRVLRPGFRPAVHPPVFLAAGTTREVRVVLNSLPITLAAVSVRGDRVCGERQDAAAWQLWEQAHTVLQATVLTERDTALRVRTLEFQGPATPGGATVVKDSSIMWVPVDPEFPRAHYDSLFERGFIRRNGDSATTYYAPNARVLLDERFVKTHCFRVAESDSTPPGMIGVRFEPMRRPRGNYTDIVGTFWLDERTYLLRQIEFGYANPPRNHQVHGAGGFVIFTRLGTGHWIMSEWSIRMASRILYFGPRFNMRKEDGTWYMNRDGITKAEFWESRPDENLWSRSQMIATVHLGDQLLFHEPAADSLASRLIPMKPGDPRLRRCEPGERPFNCTP